MSTEQPVDPRAVEETKQQIRALVGEIARLTRQDVAPEIYYAEFLQRVINALAAVAGAVWVLKDGNELRLTHQINIRQAFPDDNGDDQARHGRLLQRVLKNGEHLLVPPYSSTVGDDETGNPTSYLLVLAPILDEERVLGIVEIFQRPTSSPASQRGYLRFLSEMCAHVADYLRGRKLRELTDWQSLFTEVDRFSRNVHESLDPRTTAYLIANEGRRLIGCDRVSVGIRKGNKCPIQAVSGQDTMDTRSNAVTLLGKLATAVVRSGEPLWYTGSSEDLPPQIETAVHNYVDETHTKTVAVIPLRRPSTEDLDTDESKKYRKRKTHEEIVGALVVEQIEDSRSPAEFSQSVDMVCQHSSRALANAVEHDTLFLMPLWRAIGQAKWVIQARTLPKTLAVLAAIVTVILFLALWPWDFDMKAPGTLEPTVKKNVFVEVDGTVTTLLVDHGDEVKTGQVLLEMENPELLAKFDEVIGQLQAKQSELKVVLQQQQDRSLTAAEKAEIGGRAKVIRVDIQSLEQQVVILKDQLAKLKLTSPIDGRIVTWNPRDMLMNRPLVRGDVALTVYDPSQEWHIEAYMREDRMGHVSRTIPKSGEPMKVKYVLKSDPETDLEGTLRVEGIHDAAQLHEEHEHSVRMLVDVNETDLGNPRPGTEVTIKVHCGRKPVGYCLFHELIEFIQSRLLF